MSEIQIRPEMTVLEVTEKYPATIKTLVDNGFPKMRDPELRKTQGKALTLKAAASLRSMEAGELVKQLIAAAQADADQNVDVTLAQSDELVLQPQGDIRLSGLLPCPVRIPLLEQISALAERIKADQGKTLGYSLQAASVGIGGLSAQLAAVKGEDDLPEVFVSAGFESFFDHGSLHRFKNQGVFCDVAPAGLNASFGDLKLRDPDGHFTMLGVVPAVFLVNGPALGDLPEPRSWEELLLPRYENRLALPVGDFDLFNGLLLTMHKRFGEEGVRALGRSMVANLHPSQTVGRFAGKAQTQPAVSIVPYFFSRMTMGNRAIRVVWPEDGAVICPIFMLVKASVREEVAALTELMTSKELGEILAHRGLFPVLNPEVDNRLPEGAGFSWLGWDYIKDNDLGELIPSLNAIFNEVAGIDPGAES